MTDEKKPTATISIPAFKPAREPQPLKPSIQMRTQQELAPVAQRLVQNDALMQRFRAVIGSEDKVRAAEMMDEITKFAQNLDPSINSAEGTRIVVILMSLVGHPKGDANDSHFDETTRFCESNGRSAVTEAVVTDQDKPRPKIILDGHTKSDSTRASTELPKPKPLRTQEELTPLALRVAENAELMQRFRAVMGSGDKSLGWDVMEEITRYAQSLDPSITPSDGTTIVLILMKIVSHPKGEIDG